MKLILTKLKFQTTIMSSATKLSLDNTKSARTHKCSHCQQSFQRIYCLKRHEVRYHATDAKIHRPFYCQICNKKFARSDTLRRHSLSRHNMLKNSEHTTSQPVAYQNSIKRLTTLSKSAFNGSVNVKVINITDNADPHTVLDYLKTELISHIKPPQKWYIVLDVTSSRDENDINCGFRNNTITTLIRDELDNQYDIAKNQILTNIENFEGMGSGWKFVKVNKIELYTVEYKPLKFK